MSRVHRECSTRAVDRRSALRSVQQCRVLSEQRDRAAKDEWQMPGWRREERRQVSHLQEEDPGQVLGLAPASPGDNKTVEAITKTEQKMVGAICKACGADGDGDKSGACENPAGALLIGSFAPSRRLRVSAEITSVAVSAQTSNAPSSRSQVRQRVLSASAHTSGTMADESQNLIGLRARREVLQARRSARPEDCCREARGRSRPCLFG
jgi:hypothetical protein